MGLFGKLAGGVLVTLCLTPMSVPAADSGVEAAQDDVLRATLDNGLEVVIVESDLAPAVTTQMNYRVGSSEAPEGFPGMAHAAEHMMFRGGPELSGDQLSAITASLGANMNAFTAQDQTQYYFTVPRNDLEVALRIEATRMKALEITPEGWQDERGAINQEVSGDLSNPSFLAYTRMVSDLFAGTPYAHTPLGTRESFDNTTAEQLQTFHNDWYVPNNAVLVISGDVDPQQTLDEVKAQFGDIPRRDTPERPGFDFQPVKTDTIEMDTNDPYGSIYMAWRIPGLRDDEATVAGIMLDALGSQRGALASMGFDGTALSGGVFGNQMPYAGMAAAYGVFAAGADPTPIAERMREIIDKAASEGIDPELVSAAKRRAIADIESQRNAVSGLASAWSQAIVQQGLDSPQAMIERIKAVTPEQVNALAARVFATPPITATLTPQSSGEPVSRDSYGEPEQFGATPDGPVELPQWARSALADLDVPVSTLDPVDMTLPNGIRLIVQPESASNRLTLMGAVDTNPDLQVPEGEEGAAEILDGLYRYGSQSMDRIALQRALDEIAADESAGSSFSLSVAKDHFERGVELLAEHQRNPNFSERAFSILKQQNASSLPGYLESPDFLNSQALNRALLPDNDPALRHMTPESIDNLTLDQVRSYFDSAFRPDMTTIVVVGDITAQHAREVIERYFGDWQASGDRPDTDYPAVPLNQASRFYTPDRSASQANVTLAEMIDMNRDSDDRYALYLGNQVLSGDFASRLWRDLRVERGLVYGVSSNISLDAHRGDFEVSYGSDPEKVDEARALVIRNIERMQQAPVSDSELNRAKSKLLRSMPLSETSYSAIGGQLLSLSLAGRPLDAKQQAAEQYRTLDAATIQQVWQNYLRPDALVTGVRGPAQ
ncbi:M16 family metallopeptidase [Kushneria aurantia]|uniref:M16 family metallopeptidase n=1 Tax=Kushneria aurantia TaxID=504092 RepID=A0ABV6G1Y1_9GAMM|nr:pitrilysin family protein [Kushneria aurantia]